MKRIMIAGVLASTVSTQAMSADLLDIYRLAQDSDPGFQSASATYEAAKQKVPEAVSALLPAIGANVTGNRTLGNTAYTDTPLVQRGFNSYAWTVQLTQPILRAQSSMNWNEAYSLRDAAAAQYRQAEEDLMLRTARAYFDILIAEESIQAADAELKATHEQLIVAKKGFEKGTVAVTDVYEAQSRADVARSDRISAVNDLEDKRAALEQIIGPVPQSLSALKDEIITPRPDPDDAAIWIARAKSDSPAVLAAEASLDTAHTEVKKAYLQRMPNIDLIASIGRNYSSGNIINPDDYGTNAGDKLIGLQMTMPILDGGGIHAVVKETLANEKKAEADLETAKRKAAADARSAFAGIASGIAQIDALQSAVASGDQSVTGNRVGYQLGIRINSDVLDAERQLYSSRRDLAKARYDALFLGLQLKAAVGGLGAGDIGVINTLFAKDNSFTEMPAKSEQGSTQNVQ